MATKPITTPQEFAAALAAFTTKWGEKILTGVQEDWVAARAEARNLAKYGRVTPERIMQGAARRWLENQND